MSHPLQNLLTTLMIGMAAVSSAHAADTSERREAMREKIKSMSPEDKAAMREKAKARWDAMTPEEQAAAKKRMAERHPERKARNRTDRAESTPE